MNKELRIEQIATEVINQNQIRLQIKAALLERENDKEDIGFAIPNTIFEVRIGVEKVFEGQSDPETGIFLANIILDINGKTEIDIKITADDKADKISASIRLNISAIMTQYHDNIKGGSIEVSVEISSEDDSKSDNSEEQRKIKACIKEAYEFLLDGKYATSEKLKGIFKNVLLKHQEHPQTAREMRSLAEKRPDSAISYVKYYKGAIWAEEIISIAASKNPKEALNKLPDYCELSWAKNIVLQIARQHPQVAFSEISYYEYQPWAEEVAKEAAKIDPKAAIDNFGLYQDQPWSIAIKTEAEPRARAIEKETQKERKAREIEIVIKTAEKIIGDNRSNTPARISELGVLVKYQESQSSKESALRLADKVPKFMGENVQNYKHASWAEDVIKRIAANNPSDILPYIEGYYHTQWAQAAARKARSLRPDTQWNLDNFEELISGCSGGAGIRILRSAIDKAASRAPLHLLEQYMHILERFGWKTEIIDQIENKFPGLTEPFLR